jgi:hypothetical protein
MESAFSPMVLNVIPGISWLDVVVNSTVTVWVRGTRSRPRKIVQLPLAFSITAPLAVKSFFSRANVSQVIIFLDRFCSVRCPRREREQFSMILQFIPANI